MIWERVRLSLVLAALLASPTLAQEPRPTLDRQWLAGTWKLDKSGPAENEKNWDRTGRAKSSAASSGASGRAGGTTPAPDLPKLTSISGFGRTLIAPSETLVFQIQSNAVAIRDDFREPTRYDTTGRKTSMEVLSRHARGTDYGYVSPPRSFTVSAKTTWNGDALVQELWTRDTSEIVRISRTFIPVDHGRQMLLVIKVLEPKLKDPVKDIERVYLKIS